jgi:hypothetical protein
LPIPIKNKKRSGIICPLPLNTRKGVIFYLTILQRPETNSEKEDTPE